MIGSRRSIRLRLTLLHAGLLIASTALLLSMSWWLIGGHLQRTLPPGYADDVMSRLALQYVLGVLGTAFLALGLGWAIAGHALAPLRKVIATARRVSEENIGERIRLQPPDDELRELAQTLDAMLDRLESALESQRRFVANASHELRTPLTVIRTEADVTLADPDAGVDQLRAMGEVVLETSDRMESLLERLLLLARSRHGSLAREEIDLAAIARRVTEAAAPHATQAGVRLTFSDAGPVLVPGDQILFERLLTNLVANAIDHNRRGGSASVTVGRDASDAVVEVINGGDRIPVEALTMLAEPFQRLERLSTTRGSGLGLSIVGAVARAHGGVLRLSAPDSGGLRVEVRLPATAPSAVAAPGPARAPALIRI